MAQVTGMTQERLVATLGQVGPVKLLGLDLLRRLQPRGEDWFPTDVERHTLAQATAELIDYTRACRAARACLERLPPVPLTDKAVLEFPL